MKCPSPDTNEPFGLSLSKPLAASRAPALRQAQGERETVLQHPDSNLRETAVARALARGRAAFLAACRLDVAVRKPGNVSVHSPGHGMQAAQFLDSAQAAQETLFAPGLSVGQRIEGAVRATLAVAGCNTNLGIVLLAAPVAAALERCPQPCGAAGLQAAVRAVLRDLGVEDAAGAFRAIAAAHPGGLGRAEAQDVRAAPTLDLRAAMALAAHRDSIARQYAQGFTDLFTVGLPAFQAGRDDKDGMLRAFLAFLSRWPDSHIVRKQGAAVAQTVLKAAAGFEARLVREGAAALSQALADWDETLKFQGLNPGTSADLAVASALLGQLVARGTDRD